MLRERIDSGRAAYERRALVSLAPWLSAPLERPALCFSDTHFVPAVTAWSDDAPEDLCALIDALPEHQPWSLGDLCEWVGLLPSQRGELFTSPRLRPLWSRLRARDARVIVGNHDHGSVDVLRAQLSPGSVFDGGWSLGEVAVRHGHEPARFETALVAAIGPAAVPVYELARRWANRPAQRLPNALVLRGLRQGARCVLFGHTHQMGHETDQRTGGWINPGCFLRSAQSFAVLEGRELALYQRAGTRP